MKPFELFKAGKHVSASGAVVTITAEQLKDAADGYSADLHEAPIVVGHPKDNHPAFGWVEGLQVQDGTLIAVPKDDVDAEFAELVKAGRYKKRSASFYLPDAPNNPTPGKLYLRHAGFLGAMPPAVKGLKGVEFAENEEGVVEFGDGARWAWSSMASIARNFREWVIGEKGLEVADKVVPNYLINDLDNAAKPDPEVSQLSYSEATTMPTPAEMQATIDRQAAEITTLRANQRPADFAERETSLAARETALQSREAAIARATIEARVDAAIKAGRLLAAKKKATVDFAAGLADGEATIDFGEGDKAKKVTQREAYLLDIETRAPAVDFGEHSQQSQTGGDGRPSLADVQAGIAAQVASGGAAAK